jgi:hypothetical protein
MPTHDLRPTLDHFVRSGRLNLEFFNTTTPIPGSSWHTDGLNGFHVGPPVEAVTWSEVIYPGELP